MDDQAKKTEALLWMEREMSRASKLADDAYRVVAEIEPDIARGHISAALNSLCQAKRGLAQRARTTDHHIKEKLIAAQEMLNAANDIAANVFRETFNDAVDKIECRDALAEASDAISNDIGTIEKALLDADYLVPEQAA